MLVEFAKLDADNPRVFQRVAQLIQHLMRNQFVHSEDRGSAAHLETLNRPGLAQLVESYFDVAGYRLVRREVEGWAGILPDPERVTLQRMNVEETLVLLVMRRLWEEALEAGEIYGHGTARTTVNEAYAAYEAIVAGTRRAAMNANEFRDTLKILRKRAIVRIGEIDADEQDMDLDIRAIVTAVAGDDFVASLELLLIRPATSGEGGDEDDGETDDSFPDSEERQQDEGGPDIAPASGEDE